MRHEVGAVDVWIAVIPTAARTRAVSQESLAFGKAVLEQLTRRSAELLRREQAPGGGFHPTDGSLDPRRGCEAVVLSKFGGLRQRFAVHTEETFHQRAMHSLACDRLRKRQRRNRVERDVRGDAGNVNK